MATPSPEFFDGARKVRICQTNIDPEWSPQGNMLLVPPLRQREHWQFWSSSLLSLPEKAYLCSLLCDVKEAHAATAFANGPQAEFTRRLSACDRAWGWRGSMKAEVGFDTERVTPEPLASGRGPDDGFMPSTFPFGKLDRSGGYIQGRLRIPDIVVPYDPDRRPDGLAPSQGGNLWVIVEVKFGADNWGLDQREAYVEIAGGDLDRVLGARPEYCNCGDNLRRFVKETVGGAVTAGSLIFFRKLPSARIPGIGGPSPIPAPVR